ncbi:GNAT family N-acetyltransferase [Microbacterium sp. AGC85]
MTMLIRGATTADAHGIAVVHVTSWQAAYAGLMPQSVLDDLSIDDRAERWAHIIATPERGSRTLVAERDGEVVGWASFGAARESDGPGSGELWGVYVLPSAWSSGVGHALLEAVEQGLADDGHSAAHLWVLTGNERAATFYTRHGWIDDGGTKVEERPGLVLDERRHVKALRRDRARGSGRGRSTPTPAP